MNENKIKVFIVGTALHYAKIINNSEIVKDYLDADVAIFTGGSDVSPSFYKEKEHNLTFVNLKRDVEERAMFFNLLKEQIPMLGICRGSQFLTVMSGGKLIQHVNNHGINGTHKIKFNDGSEIDITSTHHQMMYPYNLDKDEFEIIAVSSEKRSNVYYKNDVEEYDMSDKEECEIVYYNESNCLCIQGHPEMILDNKKTFDKINSLILNYLIKKEEYAK